MLESVHKFYQLHPLLELASFYSLPRLEGATLGGCNALTVYKCTLVGVNVRDQMGTVVLSSLKFTMDVIMECMLKRYCSQLQKDHSLMHEAVGLYVLHTGILNVKKILIQSWYSDMLLKVVTDNI